MWLGLVATLALGMVYLVSYGLLVEDVPGGRAKLVKGLRCRPEAVALYGDRCPWLGPQELKEAAFTPSVFWEQWSIVAARSLLALEWLALAAALTTAIGSFVSMRSRTADRERPRPSRAEARSCADAMQCSEITPSGMADCPRCAEGCTQGV